ncbi:ABC transporter permease subunit [Nostoc sp.]|uniref:ABC transporter permease subunit n=1 Tax=Nostoc sp. TaxID=1180 RepID=UPI002FF83F42
MNIQTICLIISDTLRSATPLILAALGELVTEKSGVLNLGVDGMMVVGAVAGFIAASVTGNIYLRLFIALIYIRNSDCLDSCPANNYYG